MYVLLSIFIISITLTGCGQSSLDDVSVTAKNPAPTGSIYISNSDLAGTTVVAPQSANAILSIHGLGSSAKRTFSTSTSFQMTSGIGVD